MSENAVLTAIEVLSEQITGRFDLADTQIKGINNRLDQLNGRVQKTEKALAISKAITTAAGAVLVFFGWDGIKLWLTTLTK